MGKVRSCKWSTLRVPLLVSFFCGFILRMCVLFTVVSCSNTLHRTGTFGGDAMDVPLPALRLDDGAAAVTDAFTGGRIKAFVFVAIPT
jgi:hypothetical protein